MKAASVKDIKYELSRRSSNDLVDLCLRLSRFKKENKELLTYLLYESENEAAYIESIKREVDEQFEAINRSSYYFMKKSVRKILRLINKYNRYSKKKETEVELMIYFCRKLKTLEPGIEGNVVLSNIFQRQLSATKKNIKDLHEDLQYDYQLELEELNSII